MVISTREVIPRDFYLSHKDVDEHKRETSEVYTISPMREHSSTRKGSFRSATLATNHIWPQAPAFLRYAAPATKMRLRSASVGFCASVTSIASLQSIGPTC